ncbi:LicD family protein [Enterococcus columbae]|nr:LicD family protein [Enterococcus columbae]OJG25828.1 hypothetical protein RR47_GL001334 [Enterococcus columbae DSM 7374 = ATCC 51263]
MEHLTDNKLRKLQLTELELLKEVDRICRKNNIDYSLYAGTLLGAVRHKGFIPWDDDADIAFRPKEYQKFFEACKNDLNTEKFFLQDYRTDPNYRWGYAKLRRKNSAFIRKGQEHMKYQNGICIDLFVLYNVPNNILLRIFYNFIFLIIRKCLYSEAGMVSAPHTLLRIWYRILYIIPRNLIFSFANKLIYKQPSELISQMYYPNLKRCKYGIPAYAMEEFTELEFEDTVFKVFKEYDKILKFIYGDYLMLPPKEKRNSHNPTVKIIFPK